MIGGLGVQVPPCLLCLIERVDPLTKLVVTNFGDPILDVIFDPEEDTTKFVIHEPLIAPSIPRWENDGLFEWYHFIDEDGFENVRPRVTRVGDPLFLQRLSGYLRSQGGFDVEVEG
jgi:hypothetical protein